MDTDLSSQAQNSSKGVFQKYLLLGTISIGFITTFIAGFFLSHILYAEKNSIVSYATPTPTFSSTLSYTKTPTLPVTTPNPTSTTPEVTQDSTKFLPGKQYYEDTIMLITKDTPHITLVATVARLEQDASYAQNTRVSYYDGNNWTRQSTNEVTTDSTIVSNNLIKSWVTSFDQSRVLKQTVQGEITLGSNSLPFATGVLQNEIGVRSLPGYTKFMSNGAGTITINGSLHQAYALYTRIYSSNASDIQFYTQPFGLTTDWIAFWDNRGNFYHIDATSVDKPTPIYQTHQLGIMESADGSVTKTFTVITTRDSKNPPTQYTISMQSPVNAALSFTRINGVNKAPNGSFTWYMGNIAGSVQIHNGSAISGFGLVEYIHD